MTYTVAAGLGVVAAIAIDVLVLRTRVLLRRTFWATYPIVVIFQLLSNGVLTGRGVVRYSRTAILGVRVVFAPVEDLAFGFALVVATLSLWVWWGRRGVQGGPPGPWPPWLRRTRARFSRRGASPPPRDR